MGFPGGSGVEESACNAAGTGNTGSIPGSGRPPGGGHGNPLQYSCLENPMDKGAWRVTVHSITKSCTQPKRLSMHARDYDALGLRNTYHRIKMTSFIYHYTYRTTEEFRENHCSLQYTHTHTHTHTHMPKFYFIVKINLFYFFSSSGSALLYTGFR